jgi:hypothetical protein
MVKYIRENLNDFLLLSLAVLVTLQVRSCFDNKQPNNELYEYKLQESEKAIKKAEQEREMYRSRYDSVIAVAKEKDTVLIREIKTNTVKYEQVPVRVNNYSNDELRRAVTEY